MKKIALFSLVLVLSVVWVLPVLADELKDAQNKKSSVDSQLNKVIQQKKEVSKQQTQLEKDKKALEAQQTAEKKEYEALANELALLNEEIEKIDRAIAEAEENYKRQNEMTKARLRVMYENSEITMLETLLNSKSISEFFERVEFISMISKNDKQMLEALKTAKDDVEFKKQLREDKKGEIQELVSQKEQRIETLSISRAELESKIKKSKAELAKLEKQEDALLAESNKLINYIKSLSSKAKYAGGSMTWPLPSGKKVVSAYGMRRHPILKKNKMHTGIDIDGKTGDSIVAANKGTVIIAQWQSGYGNTVVVDHGGGITTLYAHCSKLLVKVGDEVKAGQVIAKVGSTGLATGPHLHFEVRVNGSTKNPLNYVSP